MDRLTALLNSYRPESVSVQPIVLDADEALSPSTPANAVWLCLIQQGQLTLSTRDGGDALGAGDLIWITDNKEHRFTSLVSHTEVVVCTMEIGRDRDSPLFERLPPYVHIPADLHDAAQTLAPVITLMLQETIDAQCGQSHVQNRLAEVLMVRVLRFLMRHALLNEGIIGALADLKLARAITAMHEDPGESWNVATLAKRAGMSRTAFSNGFREVVGRPPMRYLGDWRMKLASQWLRDTDQSVAQIGERLGYQSETAFRRAFRNITGTAPSHFRNR